MSETREFDEHEEPLANKTQEEAKPHPPEVLAALQRLEAELLRRHKGTQEEAKPLTAEPLTAEEEERARGSWFSRRNENDALSMLLGCFVRSLFATLDAERAKVEAAEARATAAEAEAEKVRDLIEFWFSPWGAYKSERWEEISGDQPFSPDAMLAIIRAALAKKEKPDAAQ